MSVSFCLPHPVAVSAFMICRGLCACTEMLWMCVLYVSFGYSSGSCVSSRVILGCVWNWCLSGVKSVTVDFGAEIRSELSFR